MRPIIRQSSTEKVCRYFFGETVKDYPVIEIAVRQPKINLFNDELAVWNLAQSLYKTFNWNADPSAFRIGNADIAILRTGVHFYKISYHHIGDNSKRYVALRPNTPNAQLPVWRTDKNGKLYTSIGTAINQHAGGDITTGSRGCQTAPRSQYAEFIQFIGVTPDGNFGQKTETATKFWQAENELRADGIVGANSLKIAQQLGFNANEKTINTKI